MYPWGPQQYPIIGFETTEKRSSQELHVGMSISLLQSVHTACPAWYYFTGIWHKTSWKTNPAGPSNQSPRSQCAPLRRPSWRLRREVPSSIQWPTCFPSRARRRWHIENPLHSSLTWRTSCQVGLMLLHQGWVSQQFYQTAGRMIWSAIVNNMNLLT